MIYKKLKDNKVKKFIEIMKSDELKNELIKLGGYGFKNVSTIINI